MATLKRDLGDDPPRTTTLTGTVRGKKVVMSFETLGKVAKFDTGPIGAQKEYEYFSEEEISCEKLKGSAWLKMLEDLFVCPLGITVEGTPLIRGNLKPLPKLLSYFVFRNVAPRLGDSGMIRHYKVRVLHALLQCKPVLSLKQLIMMNIWDSRESRIKKMIPHARAINKLLIQQKVIKKDMPTVYMPSQTITLARLHDWSLEKGPRRWRLTDTKTDRVLIFRNPELDPEDDEESEEEGSAGALKGGRQQSPRHYPNYNPHDVDPQLVHSLRPDGFDIWSPAEQAIFYQNSVANIRMQMLREEESRKREQWMISIMYSHEEDINNRFMFDEYQRCAQNYYVGSAHTECSTPVNWSRQPPYQPGMPRHPAP
ncbi:hypothetical protein Hdeb2414_s0019g00544581 [Helianthus debilis subsp. tardiflorus]